MPKVNKMLVKPESKEPVKPKAEEPAKSQVAKSPAKPKDKPLAKAKKSETKLAMVRTRFCGHLAGVFHARPSQSDDPAGHFKRVKL